MPPSVMFFIHFFPELSPFIREKEEKERASPQFYLVTQGKADMGKGRNKSGCVSMVSRCGLFGCDVSHFHTRVEPFHRFSTPTLWVPLPLLISEGWYVLAFIPSYFHKFIYLALGK